MELRQEPRMGFWQDVTLLDAVQAVIALSIVFAALIQMLMTGALAKGLDNALMFVMGFFFSRVKSGNGYTKSIILAIALSAAVSAPIAAVGP